ncbi:hypothetical protein LTS18_012069, partial [Coniosporium uncinatum]
MFGQSSSAPSFNFGAASQPTQAPSSSTSFKFGQPPASQAPQSQSPAPSTGGLFNFGASQASQSQPPAVTAGATSNLGQTNQAQAPAPAATSASLFNLTQSSGPSFGASQSQPQDANATTVHPSPSLSKTGGFNFGQFGQPPQAKDQGTPKDATSSKPTSGLPFSFTPASATAPSFAFNTPSSQPTSQAGAVPSTQGESLFSRIEFGASKPGQHAPPAGSPQTPAKAPFSSDAMQTSPDEVRSQPPAAQSTGSPTKSNPFAGLNAGASSATSPGPATTNAAGNASTPDRPFGNLFNTGASSTPQTATKTGSLFSGTKSAPPPASIASKANNSETPASAPRFQDSVSAIQKSSSNSVSLLSSGGEQARRLKELNVGLLNHLQEQPQDSDWTVIMKYYLQKSVEITGRPQPRTATQLSETTRSVPPAGNVQTQSLFNPSSTAATQPSARPAGTVQTQSLFKPSSADTTSASSSNIFKPSISSSPASQTPKFSQTSSSSFTPFNQNTQAPQPSTSLFQAGHTRPQQR